MSCYDGRRPMAAEPLDVRMARLEGTYQQINERLGGLSAEVSDLRRQVGTQFYWLLTFVLGSILIPILRDVIR